jgi:hypothetical protein
MTPAQFWLLHAAIAAAGGVVIMIFGRMLERALADRGEPCTGFSPRAQCAEFLPVSP